MLIEDYYVRQLRVTNTQNLGGVFSYLHWVLIACLSVIEMKLEADFEVS